VVVIGLVFWVGSCQGKSKHDEYQAYAEKVKAIAAADDKPRRRLRERARLAGTEAVGARDEAAAVRAAGAAAYTQAQQIRAPGPLRALHLNLVNAIELRAKALSGLGDVLARPTGVEEQDGHRRKADGAGAAPDRERRRVGAALPPSRRRCSCRTRGVKGVVIPSSHFVTNSDLVSSRSFTLLLDRLGGASTGGTPSGKHGDGIISVRVTAAGHRPVVEHRNDREGLVRPSRSSPTVEDSGDFQEVRRRRHPDDRHGQRDPITKHRTIDFIAAGARKTVTFTGFDIPLRPAFGNPGQGQGRGGASPGRGQHLEQLGERTRSSSR